MLVLALDSSATASVALAKIHQDSGEVEMLAHRRTSDTRSHAEVMARFVEETLHDAAVVPFSIDVIVCGTGPGPFTGLRAGIVTARTVGFAWDKPVLGLMSLYALAEYVFEDARRAGNDSFVIATDARRREVYSAEFLLENKGYTLVSGPCVGPAEEVPDVAAYGKGAGLYSDVMKTVEGFENHQPDAEYLLKAASRLGLENLSEDTSALYLRDSDAKVPAARKKASISPITVPGEK